jgi:hypothetical protein
MYCSGSRQTNSGITENSGLICARAWLPYLGDVGNENVSMSGVQITGGLRMLLSLDDDILRDGFCWGLYYEVTMDTRPRMRLPRSIIKVFQQHKVQKAWLYQGKRILSFIAFFGVKNRLYP